MSLLKEILAGPKVPLRERVVAVAAAIAHDPRTIDAFKASIGDAALLDRVMSDVRASEEEATQSMRRTMRAVK